MSNEREQSTMNRRESLALAGAALVLGTSLGIPRKALALSLSDRLPPWESRARLSPFRSATACS